MKKLFFVFILFTGLKQVNAQIDFGIKAGINFNSNTFDAKKTLANLSDYSTDDKMGYHVGIWTRFNLPVVGLYIRPELVYTGLKSEVKWESTKTDYDFKKIDIPVLIGYRFARIVHAFVGPSFQYVVDNNFSLDTLEIDADDFTVGMLLGAGVEFGNFGVDLRWERAFSNLESKFTEELTGGSREFEFDTRVNQIILGVSYKF